MTKKATLWYLYDFANSFASIVVLFYFPLLFVESGGRELVVGLASSLATLLLIIFLPPIGRWADATGKRIPLLWGGSVAMSVILLFLAFLFMNGSPSYWLLISLFMAFQFFFQGSVSIYSSLLKDIAQGADAVVISGRGVACGQLGNAVALAAVGPAVSGGALILGLSGKPLALFIGAILSFVLALPFLITASGGPAAPSDAFAFSYRALLRKVVSRRPLLLFLLGMMLLADTILTFQVYLTLYMSKVFALSDKLTMIAAVLALVFSVIGALVTAALVRRVGSSHRGLHLGALMYGIAFLLVAIVPGGNPILPLLVLVFAGISYGVVFALGRAIYAQMTPAYEQSEYFSLYTLFERAASVVGPIVWAGSFWALNSFGEKIQYRGSVLVLMVVALVGLAVLVRGHQLEQRSSE